MFFLRKEFYKNILKCIKYVIQAVVCLVITVIIVILHPKELPSIKRFKAIQKLPGPKGLWFIGSAIEMQNVETEDFLLWLEEEMNKCKRIMKIWILVISNVYFIDPDDIQILFSNTQYIRKGNEYVFLKPWLDTGLLTSGGEKWHSRRKLLTPAFHFKILEEHMNNFNKCSKVFCERLKGTKGQEIELEPFTSLLTLDIIMETAMGVNLESQTDSNNEYVQELSSVLQIMAERSISPILYPDWIFKSSKVGKRFFEAVSYVHKFSYGVIKERRKEFNSSYQTRNSGKRHRAFLDKMLEYEYENPGSLLDKDLREEVDTFMFEGHDTTSVALVYIFFNLAIYPDVQEKVYQELYEIFGSDNRDITVNDLNKMVYLEKVIKESLRLYPSVPVVTRLLNKDLILKDGTLIPEHTNVLVLIYLVHKNEKYWDDPEKFDPERFSEEQTKNRHPYAYIPFSAGPRNCIGQKFAMMELKTVVSTVIRRLRVEPVSKREDFVPKLDLVMRPKDPTKCKFIARD